MKNLKDDFMNDERKVRVEGNFLIALNDGVTFLAETVWRMKSSDRDHFRFNVPSGGEKRIEPERVEAIIEVKEN